MTTIIEHAIEIIIGTLIGIAAAEVIYIAFGLRRSTRELRALHETIDAAQVGRAFIPYPAVWRVDEKAGPLMLCEPHLEQHDQERGASFVPLQPALAGSQCTACLREAAIFKARTA